MKYSTIFYILGQVLKFEGVFLLLPFLTGMIYGEWQAYPYLAIAAICVLLGVLITSKKIKNPNTHGTGCTLSSAIAANLAKGFALAESVQNAKRYLTDCLNAMLDLGKGSGPLMHNFKFFENI